MVESPIPQDILKYKAKFVGNFSAREAAFLLAGGAAVAFSMFGLFGGIDDTTTRIVLSALPGVPFFLFGFVKPLGQPIEKIAGVLLYDNFVCPQTRKKEIRHPELEKYEKTRKWLVPEARNEGESVDEENNADAESKTKDKKAKSKKTQASGKKAEIKIKASKEFKGIK